MYLHVGGIGAVAEGGFWFGVLVLLLLLLLLCALGGGPPTRCTQRVDGATTGGPIHLLVPLLEGPGVKHLSHLSLHTRHRYISVTHPLTTLSS